MGIVDARIKYEVIWRCAHVLKDVMQNVLLLYQETVHIIDSSYIRALIFFFFLFGGSVGSSDFLLTILYKHIIVYFHYRFIQSICRSQSFWAIQSLAEKLWLDCSIEWRIDSVKLAASQCDLLNKYLYVILIVF